MGTSIIGSVPGGLPFERLDDAVGERPDRNHVITTDGFITCPHALLDRADLASAG